MTSLSIPEMIERDSRLLAAKIMQRAFRDRQQLYTARASAPNLFPPDAASAMFREAAQSSLANEKATAPAGASPLQHAAGGPATGSSDSNRTNK